MAKLSNKYANNNPDFHGVCQWDSVPLAQCKHLNANLSVFEIWGGAARLTKRLDALRIKSVLDLKNANPNMIRDRFSIVMMRTESKPRRTLHPVGRRTSRTGTTHFLPFRLDPHHHGRGHRSIDQFFFVRGAVRWGSGC